MKNYRFNLTYFVLALLTVLLLQDYLKGVKTTVVPYNEFQAALESNEIKEVVVYNEEVKGYLKEARKKDNKTVIVARRVPPELRSELEKYGVKFWRANESSFLSDIFSWLIPMLFFIGIWIFLSRKIFSGGQGSFMSVGKSKAKIYVEKKIKVSFSDVAGVDEAKSELEEVINFLKDAKHYERLGAKMPRGILLVGPPGTGKTLLAKAVAGEAAVPFFSISGSEFVEMFVGVGAARVRDLFEQARKHAPCIVFIDELDALGKARGANPMGGQDEKEQTLNQLLVELDGFDGGEGVVLLAATNRPEILDPALLRAGRFDRQVLVDRPDRIGRLQILNVHVKKIKLDRNVELEQVAALTTGFTGADLANLVNEAALFATRNNRESVTLEDFNLAIERIITGLEKKSRVLNKMEQKIVAYHEMGHAIVAASCSKVNKVHKVSIIPRGVGALGYTIQRPTEDRYLMSPLELENKMAVLLGGRASEKLFFNEMTTGSSDDIAKVTEMARAMVTKYGMIKELGHIVYEQQQQSYLGIDQFSPKTKNYSEKTAQLIDERVKEIVDKAFEKAYHVLELNRDIVEKSALELIKKETLTGEELEVFFNQLN
ncbi:MAG: ATP-dependent zinc metalloprotease FtsH [Bacteriovoracaceae bacterium]|jgi:cell division protease FtsH|nr:cell division protein FtsH [Halobacteriovoraceae bacterium]MDP7319470.1 ATP-dependent zinc metalloprotease FtsH [Bacteriovoracaceae bacterium]